ncbi:hypothetical protein sos41_30570 [Alphaproteobacteria bacterium SO-S41]|nr:hypothetical protein sos41_30570 [Alphaproteobacteria bacterium SO-S41]
MNGPLRFLSGIPLMLMAAALLVLGLQRVVPAPGPVVVAPSYSDLLIEDGQFDAAVFWNGVLAKDGDPAALRRLAATADLAGLPGMRASALERLVKTGRATLAEHVETAQLLAWAGALPDALTVMFNAERRFPDKVDLSFLSFYAALARDCRRADVAVPLAQRMWTQTDNEAVLRILIDLSGTGR